MTSPPAGAVPREKAENTPVLRKRGDESAAIVDKKPTGKASQQATAKQVSDDLSGTTESARDGGRSAPKAAPATVLPPDESTARPAARETRKAVEKTTPAQSLEYSAIQAPSASKPSNEALSPPDVQSDPEPMERSFSELPISVQVKIPRMSISMLVYAKNPPDRMISVNGKMMHEGQEVAPGLKLERITQSGAVFSYQGHRFHKGVF